MKRQPLPRLAREGFVPATPANRAPKSAMLIQKPGPEAMLSPGERAYLALAAQITPPELRALEAIANTADTLMVDGKTFLVIPTTPALLDVLAAVGSQFADMEPDDSDNEPNGDHEQDTGDLEPDCDVDEEWSLIDVARFRKRSTGPSPYGRGQWMTDAACERDATALQDAQAFVRARAAG